MLNAKQRLSHTVQQTHHKSQINLGIWLYFGLYASVALSDAFLVFTGMSRLLALLIAFGCCILISLLSSRVFQCVLPAINIWDSIAVLCLFALAFIKIAWPDSSFDTLNYHLYWQNHLTEDIVNASFFPMRSINALYLCLGDRVFYVFRTLLGYRIGTILNTLVLLLIYFQTKRLLLHAVQPAMLSHTLRQRKYIAGVTTFITLLVIYTEFLVWEIDTYYTGLLAIPFLLAILERNVKKAEQEWYDHILICLFAGISIAIKPSNIAWLAPLAIWYLIQYRQTIKLRMLPLYIVTICLPALPYLYQSTVMTGNPVFPYMNSLFKSVWFPLMGVDQYTGMQAAFGPNTLLQYLFWPVYMTFSSHTVRFSDINRYAGRMLWAMIIVLPSLLYSFVHKRKYIWQPLCSLLLVYYVLYVTIMNGHLRYSIFLEHLCGMVLAGTILTWVFSSVRNHHWVIIRKISALLLCLLLIIGAVNLTNLSILSNSGYSWTSSLLADSTGWCNNAVYLFNDYETDESPIRHTFTNDDTFLSFEVNGSMFDMLNDALPIIDIRHSVMTTASQTRAQALVDARRGNLYTLSRPGGLSSLLVQMQKLDYIPVSVQSISIPKIFGFRDDIYLLALISSPCHLLANLPFTTPEITLPQLPDNMLPQNITLFLGNQGSIEPSDPVTLSLYFQAADTGERTLLQSFQVKIDNPFQQQQITLNDPLRPGSLVLVQHVTQQGPHPLQLVILYPTNTPI